MLVRLGLADRYLHFQGETIGVGSTYSTTSTASLGRASDASTALGTRRVIHLG